jgi:hypothetical protein
VQTSLQDLIVPDDTPAFVLGAGVALAVAGAFSMIIRRRHAAEHARSVSAPRVGERTPPRLDVAVELDPSG